MLETTPNDWYATKEWQATQAEPAIEFDYPDCPWCGVPDCCCTTEEEDNDQ